MIKTTSPKISKKQLKLERENQVAKHWFEYYLNTKHPASSVTVHEAKLESDGFYKYQVSAWMSDGRNHHFEFYTKFNQENKITFDQDL